MGFFQIEGIGPEENRQAAGDRVLAAQFFGGADFLKLEI
jgi:hypothetical protein